MSGKKLLIEYRITRERVAERPGGRGQSAHTLDVDEADLPTIGRRLKEILPAKGCDSPAAP